MHFKRKHTSKLVTGSWVRLVPGCGAVGAASWCLPFRSSVCRSQLAGVQIPLGPWERFRRRRSAFAEVLPGRAGGPQRAPYNLLRTPRPQSLWGECHRDLVSMCVSLPVSKSAAQKLKPLCGVIETPKEITWARHATQRPLWVKKAPARSTVVAPSAQAWT